MFRLILLFAAIVLVLAAVPSILDSLRHVLGLGEPRPAKGRPASNAGRAAGKASSYPDTDLKRDPVCGTLIYAGSAYQKAGRGETLYFCSTHCRDEYKG
jgi:YHS domain-containing protein